MSFGAFESFALPEFIERETAPDALWVFVHIPRTGGSSFITELAKLRPDHKHLQPGSGDERISFSEKMDRTVTDFVGELGRRHYKACSGQIDMEQVDRIRSINPDTKVIALLRNPVDRVISEFRNVRDSGHSSADEFAKKYPTIYDYVDAPENRDRITRMLVPEPGASLSETLGSIDQILTFVGLLEMYPMSFNIMTRLIGQNGLPKVQRNATFGADRNLVDEELKRRIIKNNEVDIAVYEGVRQRLIARREAWKSMLVQRRPTSATTKPAPAAATEIQKRPAAIAERSKILAAPTAKKIVAAQSINGVEQLLTAVQGPPKTNTTRILRCVGAGFPDFEPYAEKVANDPRRLLAFILQSQIARSIEASEAEKTHAAAIRDLFDPLHYLENLGSKPGCENPLLHYIREGWRQKKSPNPLFDATHYLSQAGEIEIDPLLHYTSLGSQSGLDPHPLFSTRFYSRNVAQQSDNPLFHYQLYGASRRLDPSPLFRTDYVRNFVPEPFQSPLESYVKHADSRSISTHPLFDAALYRYQLEIERGQEISESAIIHYLRGGYRDRSLLPNILFDPQYYREHNNLSHDEPDLAHYLVEGDRLGLTCHPLFSANFYREQRKETVADISSLEHAFRYPDAGIRTHPRMERPLDRRTFEFIRQVVEDEREFDAPFYRMTNPDLAQLNDAQLKAHFNSDGRREGRVASARAVVQRHNIRLRDIPLGMCAEEYIELNADLAVFSDSPLRCLTHYLEHGHHEKRPHGFWQFHLEDFVLSDPPGIKTVGMPEAAARLDVCVLVHAFYPELVPELLGFAHNFKDVGTDICLNIVDLAWNSRVHRDLRKAYPGIYIQLSNDNGRDIGGFMRLLDNVDIDRYDLFAFMHTKRSPHIHERRSTYWRRALLKAFAGNPDVARDCVSLFKSEPGVGMIAAKEFRSDHMGKNEEAYNQVLDMLGVAAEKRELDYASGSMFLLRGDIVKHLHESIRSVEWEYGGDNVLAFHLDGQIAHGAERAIPALVRHMGYEIAWR